MRDKAGDSWTDKRHELHLRGTKTPRIHAISRSLSHITLLRRSLYYSGLRVGSAVEPTFSRGRGADATHGRCDEDDVDGLCNVTSRESRRRAARGGARHQRSCRERGDFSFCALRPRLISCAHAQGRDDIRQNWLCAYS